jgi:hypothetical protein
VGILILSVHPSRAFALVWHIRNLEMCITGSENGDPICVVRDAKRCEIDTGWMPLSSIPDITGSCWEMHGMRLPSWM